MCCEYNFENNNLDIFTFEFSELSEITWYFYENITCSV